MALASLILVSLVATGCGGGGTGGGGTGGPGIALTWRIEPYPPWSKLEPSAGEDAAKMLNARLRALGARGKVTLSEDGRSVSARLPHTKNDPEAIRLLGTTARLEFYDLEPALLQPSVSATGEPIAFRSVASLLRRAPNGVKPAYSTIVTCSAATATVCPGDADGVPPAGKRDYYVFKYGPYPGDSFGPYPDLTGVDVDISHTRQDFDPNTGKPVVLIQFTPAGNRAVQRVTRNEATRGSLLKTPQYMAVVLDGQIRSWPQVDYKQNPKGIDPTGSGMEITGLKSLQEAKNLASALQTGSVPVRLVLISQRNVD
jgi:preprotein translocase subunit SecD